MAKLSRGILGAISGKIGPVVGASWKGINYVRSIPKKVDNKSRTSSQIANEGKFRFFTRWFSPFHPYVNVGYRNYAQHQTEINAAFKCNYPYILVGAHPNLEIDYSKLLLSKGDYATLDEPIIKLVAEDKLTLTWETNASTRGLYNDQLMLVVYCPDLKKADGFIGGTKRAALHCDFQLPLSMIGKCLEIYVSTYSLDGKKMSNSIYLGKVCPL